MTNRYERMEHTMALQTIDLPPVVVEPQLGWVPYYPALEARPRAEAGSRHGTGGRAETVTSAESSGAADDRNEHIPNDYIRVPLRWWEPDLRKPMKVAEYRDFWNERLGPLLVGLSWYATKHAGLKKLLPTETAREGTRVLYEAALGGIDRRPVGGQLFDGTYVIPFLVGRFHISIKAADEAESQGERRTSWRADEPVAGGGTTKGGLMSGRALERYLFTTLYKKRLEFIAHVTGTPLKDRDEPSGENPAIPMTVTAKQYNSLAETGKAFDPEGSARPRTVSLSAGDRDQNNVAYPGAVPTDEEALAKIDSLQNLQRYEERIRLINNAMAQPALNYAPEFGGQPIKAPTSSDSPMLLLMQAAMAHAGQVRIAPDGVEDDVDETEEALLLMRRSTLAIPRAAPEEEAAKIRHRRQQVRLRYGGWKEANGRLPDPDDPGYAEENLKRAGRARAYLVAAEAMQAGRS